MTIKENGEILTNGDEAAKKILIIILNGYLFH